MVIPGIEGDDDLAVPSLAEGDPMTIVGILKERNNHAGEGMTVPERVCNAVLPSAMDLRDHQDVVEEEHLSLVLTRSIFLVGICNLVEATVANQTSIRHS